MKVLCQNCGTEFNTNPHRLLIGRGKYCSVACRGEMRTRLHLATFWAQVDKRGPDECWPWIGPTWSDGLDYGRFTVNKHNYRAHRLAYELTNNIKLESAVHILHSCDNPPCCNPGHLSEGTRADNSKDMWIKGRGVFGETQRRAYLSEAQVIEILRLYREGSPQWQLAQQFSTTQSNISLIVRGKNWSYLHRTVDEAA
jgi:hypothetical protein